jgi:HAD superfamily hydrolase (TIGR01509 family)
MKTILVDAVFTLVSEEGKLFEKMYELLESYPNKKIVLTNASHDKFAGYGLDKLSYEVFTLEHNPEKTDRTYFDQMLKHFSLKASDAVYFENNIEAVDSAKSAGITAYHYDKDKKDLIALKEFLDKNL